MVRHESAADPKAGVRHSRGKNERQVLAHAAALELLFDYLV